MPNDISSIIEKIEILKKEKKTNEENTKNYLVLPFISFLGYDITSPLEVRYEYVCDIHEKGNRKVDCAVLDKHLAPHIIIEVKPLGSSLYDHIGQLKQYFFSCPAKYALLTDGNKYLVFTREQIDGNFLAKPPAYIFEISTLFHSEGFSFDLLSKDQIAVISPVIEEQLFYNSSPFALYCRSISLTDLIGVPTNTAYIHYENFCKEHNEIPICHNTWSKLIKKQFSLKIIDKKISGVKRRIFMPLSTK